MAKKKKASQEQSFEEHLTALETAVSRLEEGDASLEDALKLYEQGISHLKACHQALGRAQRKIELLTGVDASGEAVTQPFDEDADSTLVEKADSRSKKRSRHVSSESGHNDEEDPTASLF